MKLCIVVALLVALLFGLSSAQDTDCTVPDTNGVKFGEPRGLICEDKAYNFDACVDGKTACSNNQGCVAGKCITMPPAGFTDVTQAYDPLSTVPANRNFVQPGVTIPTNRATLQYFRFPLASGKNGENNVPGDANTKYTAECSISVTVEGKDAGGKAIPPALGTFFVVRAGIEVSVLKGAPAVETRLVSFQQPSGGDPTFAVFGGDRPYKGVIANVQYANIGAINGKLVQPSQLRCWALIAPADYALPNKRTVNAALQTGLTFTFAAKINSAVCVKGQTACGGVCTNILTDIKNCGACSLPITPQCNGACVNGACEGIVLETVASNTQQVVFNKDQLGKAKEYSTFNENGKVFSTGVQVLLGSTTAPAAPPAAVAPPVMGTFFVNPLNGLGIPTQRYRYEFTATLAVEQLKGACTGPANLQPRFRMWLLPKGSTATPINMAETKDYAEISNTAGNCDNNIIGKNITVSWVQDLDGSVVPQTPVIVLDYFTGPRNVLATGTPVVLPTTFPPLVSPAIKAKLFVSELAINLAAIQEKKKVDISINFGTVVNKYI